MVTRIFSDQPSLLLPPVCSQKVLISIPCVPSSVGSSIQLPWTHAGVNYTFEHLGVASGKGALGRGDRPTQASLQEGVFWLQQGQFSSLILMAITHSRRAGSIPFLHLEKPAQFASPRCPLVAVCGSPGQLAPPPWVCGLHGQPS